MADEKDEPEPREEFRAVWGESMPPDEHTLRVRARKKAKKPSVYDENTLSVPETDSAARRKKEVKRARDRLALRRGLQVAVFLALIIGGVGFFVVQNFVSEKEFSEEDAKQAIAERKKPKPKTSHSTPYKEVPHLPALELLKTEGLTICAEGLPKVDASETDEKAPVLAGVETCRFAYGVWEFSPNKRFRFLSTCKAFEGQVLVGAYEIEGSRVRLSPLKTTYATLFSIFSVERPAQIKTVAEYKGYRLLVEQRVTVVVPGLRGDAFLENYASKNSIQLTSPRDVQDPPASPSDRLLKLLKKGG